MKSRTNQNKAETQGQRKDTEQLNQIALGSNQAEVKTSENDNNLIRLPKISGTGSNPSSSTPHSLIVHENRTGKERYEEGGEDKTPSQEE